MGLVEGRFHQAGLTGDAEFLGVTGMDDAYRLDVGKIDHRGEYRKRKQRYPARAGAKGLCDIPCRDYPVEAISLRYSYQYFVFRARVFSSWDKWGCSVPSLQKRDRASSGRGDTREAALPGENLYSRSSSCTL